MRVCFRLFGRSDLKSHAPNRRVLVAGIQVIIIGGISVNDPGGHDRFPYNFINPAARRAKKYKAKGGDVLVIVFSPPYETRVEKQGKEHRSVTYTQVDDCSLPFVSVSWCPDFAMTTKPDPRHFINVLKKAGLKDGYKVIEMRDKDGLTSTLQGLSLIASIDYFGHSDDKYMFLEYSSIVSRVSKVYWGEAEAKAVPATKFAPGASFVSFGCNQGDPGGLAEQLRGVWKLRTVGSNGKTDFEPIGAGLEQPTSALGYLEYPADGGPPRKLTTPP